MITDKQRENRAKGIGSSEAATIMGCNRWQTPYDLWLIKTGRAQSPVTNNAMRLGQVLEPTLLQLAGERLGTRIVRPSTTFVGHRPHFRANIDGMVGEAKRGSDIVEIKTTGVADEWGTEGTDQVPMAVRVQVSYQMACSSSHLAHVGCLVGSWGLHFKLYRVEFDSGFTEYLLDRIDAWWGRHIVEDVPPAESASIDLLKTMERIDDEKDMSDHLDLFTAEETLKRELDIAERKYEAAKSELLKHLGSHRRGRTGPYSIAVTDVATDRFDRKSFEAEHPELASRFVVPSGYKRIDIRKKKD